MVRLHPFSTVWEREPFTEGIFEGKVMTVISQSKAEITLDARG